MRGVRSSKGLDVPDVVQTCRFDLLEVVLDYPSLPMVLQHAKGDLLALHLPEGVFVHNGVISRVLEDTGRYPRLYRVE